MRRLLGASIVICALVGFMSDPTPHFAQAQTTPPAGDAGIDSPTEQGPAPPEGPVSESSKAQTQLAGTTTDAPTGLWKGTIGKLWIWVLAVAAVLIAVGFMLGRLLGNKGTDPGTDPCILKLGPSFFFWLGTGYTGLLMLMAVAYNFLKYAAAPDPYLLNGVLPVAVPWFGALGAVTISMEGVFLWNDQWKVKFNYWHIGRPLFGAVLGVVAFFLFVVIASASGTKPEFLKTGKGETEDFLIFYVVAFLVGYREETFRDLIKRATDLILKPGAPSAPSPAVTFKDRTSGTTLQEVSLSTESNRSDVEVHNTGDGPLLAPSVAISVTAPAVAETFVVASDNVTGADLSPGQSRTIVVSFNPKQPGTFFGTLAVKANNLGTPVTIRIKGTASEASATRIN